MKNIMEEWERNTALFPPDRLVFIGSKNAIMLLSDDNIGECL